MLGLAATILPLKIGLRAIRRWSFDRMLAGGAAIRDCIARGGSHVHAGSFIYPPKPTGCVRWDCGTGEIPAYPRALRPGLAHGAADTPPSSLALAPNFR